MDWENERAALLARGLTADDRERLDELRERTEKGEPPPEVAAGRWLNVRPDPIDFRDRFYEPGLRPLRARLDPDRGFLDGIPVRDQRVSKACTGMALAGAIDLLRWRLWHEDGEEAVERPQPVSAWMLYEMARAFDEFPDDGLFGSSIRGALRGFFHNGVCDEDPEDLEFMPAHWRLDVARAKAARNVSLGVYMRLRHVLLDYHAALNEIGALVVSARIHSGWQEDQLVEGGAVIPWHGTEASLGLHAFLVVGYDRKGFVVRNSWGAHWGGWIDRAGQRWPGVACWAYDDWQRNAIDAWALRLAVFPPEQFNAVGGLQASGGVAVPSVSRTPPRIAINGHYLHVKDGRLVQSGVFNSHLDSIRETAELLATSENYRHLVLIVESGLEALETMARRATILTPYMKALGVYPVFVFWRDDVFALTSELLEDRARRLEARSGGFPALSSLLLDRFAREFMPPVWRTFEGEVERAFSTTDNQRGEAWPALLALLDGARRNPNPLQLHFVAHGTGALWLNRLLARIAETGALASDGVEPEEARRQAITTINLLAPICSPDSFSAAITALWGDAAQRSAEDSMVPVAIYTLAEKDDASDRVGAFEGSFLELARRAFPIDGAVPARESEYCAVLGHATEANGLSRPDTTCLIVREPPIGATCRSHRGLASDVLVLSHVLGRICRGAPGATATPLDLPESALLPPAADRL